jgi:drug/metabolite transporter (DMT)-like permease
MSVFFILIPTLLDYIAVNCYYTAFNLIPVSVYQLLRGGTVMATYIFRSIILKHRPTRPKSFGCLVVLIGLIFVGITNMIYNKNSHSNPS